VTRRGGTRGQPLAGKVVAITGGARGIGRAIARTLAAAGAHVAIGDIDPGVARQTAEELTGVVESFAVDVADAASFKRFIDDVETRLGPLDVLVNNAGVMPTGPIEHEDALMSERAIAINLLGVIHGTKLALARMKPRGRGHVVNIASVGARVAGARAATYTASKAGVLGFSEAVALELARTGVEMSVILPAMVNTELVSGIPVRRGTAVCDPEDVATAVLAVIRRPRFQLMVPRRAAIAVGLIARLPAGMRLALIRAAKTDELIDDMDRGAHAGYEARLRETVSRARD